MILKSLKDCQKIRLEDAGAFAPTYILQKVWLAGLNPWTTRALKEEFAKNLGLQMLLDADIPKVWLCYFRRCSHSRRKSAC